MSQIVTNVQTAPVPGLWHRMAALQSSGADIAAGDLLAKMDELSIPRDQRAVAHALTTWARSSISVEEGFALWLLRQRQDPDGGFRRQPDSHTAEINPTIRYVQLAVGAGETVDTDDHLRRALEWLLLQIRNDGGVPDFPGGYESEVGTTGRALRALSVAGFADAEAEHGLMEYLVQSATPMAEGKAWRTQPSAPAPATGATSIAVFALCSTRAAPELVGEACRWLISVQNDDGGWDESSGDDGSALSASSNTFNVVRALLVTDGQTAVDSAAASRALARARDWCVTQIPRFERQTPHDTAFMLRLAVALGLDTTEDTLALAEHLRERAQRRWSTTCDLYVEVELVALSLQEWRVSVQSQGTVLPMTVPPVPPPFLRRQAHIHDLLYRLSARPRWIRTVDRFASAGLIEAMIGATLGTVGALAVLDDRILSPLADVSGTRSVFAVTMLALALASWSVARGVMRRSRRTAIASLGTDIAAAFIVTAWTVYAYDPTSSAGVFLVLAANFLVIDIIAYSADQSGVVSRLLPES